MPAPSPQRVPRSSPRGRPLPDSATSAPSLAEAASAIAACRASLREGSYTFFAASLLLPAAVRSPASALYAFCRMADDAVDNVAEKHAAVARLQARLDAVYAGEPRREGPDYAFAAVVGHFGIPRAVPEALIEGFAWDAQGRRYETLDDLLEYAARVAGTVGAMMALVMGVRTAQGLARACELGIAMQLSNIARDVGEDARAGRLYLPRQWLHEAGIDADAWLAAPVQTPPLGRVVRRLLDHADALYAGVGAGVAQLPVACRPGINAARFLYAAIGHEVARAGLDAVTRRAVVPPARKAGLLLWALVQVAPAAAAVPAVCLPAARFLVEAAAASAMPEREQDAGWWRVAARVDQRAAWTIDLFERLARDERGWSSGRTASS